MKKNNLINLFIDIGNTHTVFGIDKGFSYQNLIILI
jgi:pantothenate kinase type III